MIEAPHSSWGLGRWAAVVALAAAFVVGLASAAGWVASQCQCHYTAALFAERDGLQRVVLPISAPEGAARRELIEQLEDQGLFVDPTFSQGTSDTAAVYAPPERHQALIEWAGAHSTSRRY